MVSTRFALVMKTNKTHKFRYPSESHRCGGIEPSRNLEKFNEQRIEIECSKEEAQRLDFRRFSLWLNFRMASMAMFRSICFVGRNRSRLIDVAQRISFLIT